MPPLPLRLEITPPRTRRAHVLLRRAGCLGALPRRIHVIERPERWSSLGACAVLLRAARSPVWHLSTRGRSITEIERAVDRAREIGLSEVLCIRGEHKEPDALDTPRIRDVVALLGRRLPEARVAVGFDPLLLADAERQARALRNLRRKLEAGARTVQTQVCFDLAPLDPVAAVLRAEHPGVEIWPMLVPVESPEAARRVSQRLGVPLPGALLDALARRGAEAGWAHFETLVRRIDESPLYAGATLMMPVEPDPELAARVTRALAAASGPRSGPVGT